MERELVVTFDNGQAQFVYDDRLAFLTDHGGATIVRASHVEPVGDDGGWSADMTPALAMLQRRGVDTSAMPDALGPFKLRQDALDAERDWLSKYCGL